MLTAALLFSSLIILAWSVFRSGQDLNPGCVLVDDALIMEPPVYSDRELFSNHYGFLGFIGKAIGAVAGAVGSVAKVIPGVGTAIAAGASALSAVLKGGSATAQAPGGGTTVIGTVPAGQQPMQAGFWGGLTKQGPLGIPIIVYVMAGGGLLYIILKRKKIL